MRDTERGAQTQAEGEAGSMQGARCGTQSRVSRITPWAEGGTKPLSHPGCPEDNLRNFVSGSNFREKQGKNIVFILKEKYKDTAKKC